MPDRSSNPPNAYQQLNNPGAAITQLTRDIAENNANTTQKSISSIGTLASGPVLELSDSAQDVLYALFSEAHSYLVIFLQKPAPPHCVLWDLPRPAIQPRHTKGKTISPG